MIQDNNTHGCIANPEEDAQKYPMTVEDPHLEIGQQHIHTVFNCPTIMRFEQPAPKPNDKPVVIDRVIEALKQREARGLQTYGTRLQPHNGRDALQDALEEVLDAAMYIQQAIMEREGW